MSQNAYKETLPFSTGIDIGGTKIAAAVFDDKGNVVAQKTLLTPAAYVELLDTCRKLILEFDEACKEKATIGIGTAGMIDRSRGAVIAPNIPCLKDHPFRDDIQKVIGRPLVLANDADCAALAEAIDGAGQGYHSVFGLVMGTGVGGGLVIDGKIHQGPHGLAGEIGHLPLPYREESDGPIVECGCGQMGCIDKSISGPSLARLYRYISGVTIEDDHHVLTSIEKDTDHGARVFDQFYTTVAKALVTVIHAFDPEIIVVTGGLNKTPGLYDEVPKRWGKYAMCKTLHTKIAPAKHGTLCGVKGAALVGKA